MLFSDLDRTMMQRALELARRGIGRVSPNPLVGCVIMTSAGEILGEGAHLVFGGPHAELNAIRDAEAKGHSVEGATVYVTLEPHSHQGKTPPCSKLLVKKKIGRCVIATEDPYKEVHGNGIRELREAGIQVDVGLLQEEAREQNRFFFKHVTTGLPYLTLKIASSLDGRSALASGQSKWITSEASRTIVHQMRAEHDAVLIGTGTALADDPSLTVRLVEGRNPKRIVLDANFNLPDTLRLFTDGLAETIVIASCEAIEREKEKSDHLRRRGIDLIGVKRDENGLDLLDMLTKLAAKGIASILAEAGPTLAGSLAKANLFEELALFFGPVLLGSDARPAFGPLGVKALNDVTRLRLHEARPIQDSEDLLIRLRPQR